MCGICGFYTKKRETLHNLIEMNNMMTHRGPDDHGEEIYTSNNSDYCIGMAHRRLSIMDLSFLGHQPMHSKNKKVTVVFNGEIYNFIELKEELKEYPFVSNCDTEVIIAAYLEWGIECINKFNGMYAIAIYDREDESVYLIRDRIGKKPLYYYLNDGNLYFASELKALMANPHFEKEINENIIAKFIYMQYINAPDSIFQNTFKLEPGGILKFRNGKVDKWKYWDVAENHKKSILKISYGEAVEEMEHLLKESVKRRMAADVPVGEFLSGGYDSALICSLAQSLSQESIRTYSIGFEDKKLDEAPYAKEIAKYLGTNHTEYYISQKEMFELIRSIPKYYDEPFADSSQICTMLVSELAKKDVTVVLTGDGGDELFGGYTIYKSIKKAQEKKVTGVLLNSIYKIPLANRIYNFRKLPFVYRVASESLDSNIKTQVGSGQYLKQIDKFFINKEPKEYLYYIEDNYGEKNWVYKRMLLDIDTYLPGDILCKVDRASMKYSLEVRCPFLDKELLEFSLRLPLEYKYSDNDLKRIIKDVTYKYIPKELMDRPKQGFGVPREKWLRNELKDELLDYLEADFVKNQGIFDAVEIRKIVESYLEKGDMGANTGQNYGRFVWSYYIFQQWYTYYMKAV